MSDSDSDYEEVLEDNIDGGVTVAHTGKAKPKVNRNGVNVRGKDIEWIEFKNFDTVKEFKESQIKGNLDSGFTRRKARSFEYGDVEDYVCKFERKVGFLGCPVKYKVTYSSTSSSVTVECNMGNETHDHQTDPDHGDGGNYFRWTTEQTDLIKVNIHNKPNKILRILEEANAFGAQKPTKQQFYNKHANLKKLAYPYQNILNTHDLRQRVSANLEVPEDDVKGYVVYSNIDDENEDEEPRFTIIFSTNKNLGKLRSERVLQTDATYRLNWHGFPVFIVGKMSDDFKKII